MNSERIAILIMLLLTVCNIHSQQRGKEYIGIGFYNLENLFDTIHAEGKNDYEFLPKGVNEWGSHKYNSKIDNMASVLADMGSELCTDGASLVGVCEVENSRVLDDLTNSGNLKKKRWRYIHFESDDTRGIDCALIYNPAHFKPENCMLIPYADNNHHARGFLIVGGILFNEHIHVIVNHWPSRHSKSPAREYAATKVMSIKDSITAKHPKTKIIIMGDFNDNPDNQSIKTVLGAKRFINEVKNGDLYNPWWNILRKEKRGTYRYQERWHLYDQIIISGNMCGNRTKGLKYFKSEIHSRPHMLNSKGPYTGNPKRTHAGGEWLNGYSDHLPVVIYLKK